MAGLSGIAPAVAGAEQAGQLDTSFSPSTVAVGAPTTLNLNLSAPAGTTAPIENVGFKLDAGYGVGLTPGKSAACGGTLTIAPSQNYGPPYNAGPVYELQLSGATVTPGSPCSINVPATGAAAGSVTPMWEDGTNVAEANGLGSLNVTTTESAPQVRAAFSPSSVTTGGSSTLKINLTNPNANAGLTNVGVGATGGGAGAFSSISSNTCGGSAATGVLWSSSPESLVGHGGLFFDTGVGLGGGTLPPGGSCSVTARTNPFQTPATFAVTGTSAEGGGTQVQVPISVTAPKGPTASLALAPRAVRAGGVTVATLKLHNPNAQTELNDVFFSHELARGVAIAASRHNKNRCGGRYTGVGNRHWALRDGHLKAGATCVITIALRARSSGHPVLVTGRIGAKGGLRGAGATAKLSVSAPRRRR